MSIQRDPVRRDLALMGLFLTLFIPPAVATALQRMGVSIVWFGAVCGVAGIVAGGVVGGVAGIVAVGVEVLRLPDDLLLALPTWFIWSRRTLLQRPWLPRMTVIPIPGLRARLERWLMYDWSAIVHTFNQILARTAFNSSRR